MKRTKYMFLCALFAAGTIFGSCFDNEEDDDGISPDPNEQDGGNTNHNNNNQNGNDDNGNGNSTVNDNDGGNTKSGELAEFYAKMPKMFSYLANMNNYDEFKAMVPAGIYVFPDGDDGSRIFAKGTDESLIMFTSTALAHESAYIGNTCYFSSYGDDGKTSAYIFYNDHFNEPRVKAPTACRYEYETREDMLQPTIGVSTCQLSEMYTELVGNFLPISFTRTDIFEDEEPGAFQLHSEGKTNLNGIECNYYYITYTGTKFVETFGGSIPEKVQEWWFTDNFLCLQMYDWISDDKTQKKLTKVMPAGTFEENYATISEKFNYWGRTELSDALQCHKKFGNHWLSDEYPEYLDKWLVRYPGEISSFEITRRAWKGIDHICTIKFEVNNPTMEEVTAYIAEVRKLPLPNVYHDVIGSLSADYSAADEELGDGPLGSVGIYPSVEVFFNDFSSIGVNSVMTMQLDLVRQLNL